MKIEGSFSGFHGESSYSEVITSSAVENMDFILCGFNVETATNSSIKNNALFVSDGCPLYVISADGSTTLPGPEYYDCCVLGYLNNNINSVLPDTASYICGVTKKVVRTAFNNNNENVYNRTNQQNMKVFIPTITNLGGSIAVSDPSDDGPQYPYFTSNAARNINDGTLYASATSYSSTSYGVGWCYAYVDSLGGCITDRSKDDAKLSNKLYRPIAFCIG